MGASNLNAAHNLFNVVSTLILVLKGTQGNEQMHTVRRAGPSDLLSGSDNFGSRES